MATIMDPPPSDQYSRSLQITSQKRGMAMVFAMVTAIVLSPLYVDVNKDAYLETRLWNSGFLLPMVLGGLIVAIKTTSSCSSSSSSSSYSSCSSNGGLRWSEEEEKSSSLRNGRCSWGLGLILGMMVFVVYWKESVQRFFWR